MGDEEVKATELLPCPFCLKDVTAREIKGAGYSLVSCSDPSCVASAISALPVDWNARASAWQGIETAPKDGRVILVTGCNGFDRVLPAWWVDENEVIESFAGWRGVVNRCGPNLIADPTHWQPLPPPPETAEGQE